MRSIFDELLEKLDAEAIRIFNDSQISENEIEDGKLKGPSATWTYLINDKPFENLLGLELIGNIGMGVGAGILGPVIALSQIFKSFKKKRRS